MTETDIIKRLSHWIDDRKHPFQLSNVFIYAWESDYWTMTAHGETREYEIKISRSDYFNDAKKAKHTGDGGANYFYYVCPSGLIAPNEVDQKYGLIYVGQYVQVVKKPRKLNDNPFDKWKELACKMYWRYRGLWKEKFLAKEITRAEYVEGFNIQLDGGILNETP